MERFVFTPYAFIHANCYVTIILHRFYGMLIGLYTVNDLP